MNVRLQLPKSKTNIKCASLLLMSYVKLQCCNFHLFAAKETVTLFSSTRVCKQASK